MSTLEQLVTEGWLRGGQAARKAGVCRQTIRRWIVKGVRGGTIRLEGRVTGREIRTTGPAIDRFFARCADYLEAPAETPVVITPAAQRRRQSYVEGQLRKLGVMA